MKILLREDIPNLGSLGDEVEVAPGFARNYLVPSHKAFVINKQNYKKIAYQKKLLEEKRQKIALDNQTLAEKIAATTLVFTMKTSAEGKLFGAVNAKQILDELEKNGISLDKKHALNSEHIKMVGDYEIPVKLHATVSALLKVKVMPEEPLADKKDEEKPVAESKPPLASADQNQADKIPDKQQ